MSKLRAPFPYFGGKSIVAPVVWQAFGVVRSYVEPFAGSLAVLLGRPDGWTGTETVNDADGLLSNFWRAMTRDPEQVILAAEWPVSEADLHARHMWLVGNRERITERLMGDPDWCDPRAAGWWVWGLSCWIGGGWCSGDGPWVARDGLMVRAESNTGRGVSRRLPRLSNTGQGVNRKRPHLGDAGRVVNRQTPDDSEVTRQRHWLSTLVERLRYVRVACGDWSRVCSRSVTHPNAKVAAVFLDPPYSVADRRECYAMESRTISHDVRAWAVEHGADPAYRIILAGYDGEHDMPPTWRVHVWEARGGYANSRRERLWLSPHCLPIVSEGGQGGLFG